MSIDVDPVSAGIAFLAAIVAFLSWRAAVKAANAAHDALEPARKSAAAAEVSANAAREALGPAQEAAEAAKRSAEVAEAQQDREEAPKWDIDLELLHGATCRASLVMKDDGPNVVDVVVLCQGDVTSRENDQGEADVRFWDELHRFRGVTPGAPQFVDIDLHDQLDAELAVITVQIFATERRNDLPQGSEPRMWTKVQTVRAEAFSPNVW